MALRNRFVRSATWEGMADPDGSCNKRLSDLLEALAEGMTGLIITSHAFVDPKGRAGPWQLAIWRDEFAPELERMTRAVHKKGGAIVLQISHAGFFAPPRLIGGTPAGPSAVSGFTKTPRSAMDVPEIRQVVDAFGLAANRARKAGFDGVQIHAAHGYLLSQFLSPVFNKREDAYGGNVENRAKIVLDVLGSIRRHAGSDYPVLIKMNCEDFLSGGLTLKDSIKTAVMLQDAGLDAVELSGGTLASGEMNPSRTGILSEEKEAYFKGAARAFKAELHIPLILVGGIRSFHVAEEIVDAGTADYISMSRPFICEPDLVRRWASGDRSKAACLSDSKCFGPALSGKGIACVVKEALKNKNDGD